MATTNSKFLVKNGLAVAGSTGAIDVINTSGQWIGATGTLSGATGAIGPAGATGTSGDRYLTTSSTSFTIADTGSQTVTIGTGLAYSANQTIILTYDASNHQHGRVTSYNPSTGELIFDKYDFQGSGTYASWTVNLDGAVGAQGASGATGVIQNWSVKTTTYTAVNKDSIVANTSGGAFTITLPATPSTGWSVSFADPAGTWDTNNLTVARNGSTIEGSATDLVLDVSHVSVDLVYDGSTWQVFTNIGPPGATGVSVQGASGATGVNGATGATGVQGASGVGASGVNGATGVSVQGASGATGATGVQGASGVAGTNGATGPAGSNGIDGATGTAGVNGATGPGADQALDTTSNVQHASLGIGTTASGTAGEIRATNNVTAYFSDERLKTKLSNIDNALNKVNSLSGFYYQANEVAQALGYEVKKEVGVSAQEVQAIMPEVVAPAPIDDKYLTVRYEKLIPLLIEAIKELTDKINVLESNQKN